MKTSELSGDALNYAVALCEQRRDEPESNMPVEWHWADFCRVWDFGGEIIERERVDVMWCYDRWCAYAMTPDGSAQMQAEGDTPLIAAMRAYAVSRLGDEIDIPEELTD